MIKEQRNFHVLRVGTFVALFGMLTAGSVCANQVFSDSFGSLGNRSVASSGQGYFIDTTGFEDTLTTFGFQFSSVVPLQSVTFNYVVVTSGLRDDGHGHLLGYGFISFDSFNMIRTSNGYSGTVVRPADVHEYGVSGNLIYLRDTYRASLAFDVFAASDYIGDPFSFTISAIPEPSTWGLMIFGLGVLGVTLRSRRKKPTASISP